MSNIKIKCWTSISAAIRDPVRDLAKASTRDLILNAIWKSVSCKVRISVRTTLRSPVGALVRESVRDTIAAMVHE